MNAAQQTYEACRTTFDLIRHAVSQNRMITVLELNECFQKCGQAVRAFEQEQATAAPWPKAALDLEIFERAAELGEAGE